MSPSTWSAWLTGDLQRSPVILLSKCSEYNLPECGGLVKSYGGFLPLSLETRFTTHPFYVD
jgi:hypothetical protein